MSAWGWLFGLTLLGASPSDPSGEQDLRPGVALPPDQPTPEAALYEALLQTAPVLPAEDTVPEKRRRFDDRGLRLGAGLSLVNASLLTALYTEVDAANRMTLGSEVGISLWGLLAGGYVRLRPAVWGGGDRGALHAIALEAGYRYMQYGDGPLDGILSSACHGDCERVEFMSQPVHFLTLNAGFEHAFASDWIVRYGLGAGTAASGPRWSCQQGKEPVACGGESPPTSRLLFLSFVVSRAIF